jgi:uncharacterized protein YbjT (DUF2867 family)
MIDADAIILGASGLVGSSLLQQLMNDEQVGKIRILVRRYMDVKHPKVEQELVNFEDLAYFKKAIGTGKTVYCCIGTTMKQVKRDKLLYRKIDFDIPVNAAKFASENGIRQYVLVSAIGSNASSGNFYIRLKGEVEEAICEINFDSVHIMQPSFLTGPRREFRPLEIVFKPLMWALSFLLVGGLKKYKPIAASTVATAMIAAAKQNDRGVHRYTYEDMIRISS